MPPFFVSRIEHEEITDAGLHLSALAVPASGRLAYNLTPNFRGRIDGCGTQTGMDLRTFKPLVVVDISLILQENLRHYAVHLASRVSVGYT